MALVNVNTYDEIVKLIKSSKREVIVSSPFISVNLLKDLLLHVPSNVSLSLFTRWYLTDLLGGFNSLEVYEILVKRGAKLYINPRLHSKLYISDRERVIIGSSNLTYTGLSLVEKSNIEFNYQFDLSKEERISIEKIFSSSHLVDDTLYREYKALVENNSIYLQEFDNTKELDNKVDKLLSKRTPIAIFDFPFTSSPDEFLRCHKEGLQEYNYIHDAELLGIDLTSKIYKKDLIEKFRLSKVYSWQYEMLKDVSSMLFGKYSQLLHREIIDDPKPYRKTIKELVSNMFNWSLDLCNEIEIKQYNNTKSIYFK
jgi:hypothetical protein